MSHFIQNANDHNFKEIVLDAQGTVLVDFWATWCQPCKRLSPLLEEVAEQMIGQLKFVKVNVEDAPETVTEYGLSSVPSLLVFRNGQEVVRSQGAPATKQRLQEWIEKSCL